MSRTIHYLQIEDENGEAVSTGLVAMSDDDTNFRIHRGAAYDCIGGRTAETYTMPKLWEGDLGELDEDILHTIMAPGYTPAPPAKRAVVRRRK